MAKSKATLYERFIEKVSHEPNTGCWLWTGAVTVAGYGNMWAGSGKWRMSHRVAYELFRGPISEGLHIDHLCRVRCCVNPWHLEAVTPMQNIRRGKDLITHCPAKHQYSRKNTSVDCEGKRHCRECDRLRHLDARRIAMWFDHVELTARLSLEEIRERHISRLELGAETDRAFAAQIMYSIFPRNHSAHPFSSPTSGCVRYPPVVYECVSNNAAK